MRCFIKKINIYIYSNESLLFYSILSRFDELHHMPVEERKPAMRALKVREERLGELLSKLAKERVRRRTREFSQRALDTQRKGQRLEREELERLEAERMAKIHLATIKASNIAFMGKAMAVDEKWMIQELTADAKEHARQVHNASLNYHVGFSAVNPAPREREHPYSWRLKPCLEDGTPLSPEAVVRVCVVMCVCV